MSTTGGGPPAGVATLIFDVLGTVVDEAGSVTAETVRGAGRDGDWAGPGGPRRDGMDPPGRSADRPGRRG